MWVGGVQDFLKGEKFKCGIKYNSDMIYHAHNAYIIHENRELVLYIYIYNFFVKQKKLEKKAKSHQLVDSCCA